MLQRTLVFALTPMMVGVWLSPETATAQSRQGHSPWLKTESRHFEIHYLPALARELDRVVRSAERAYDRISGRSNFVLATKGAAGDVCTVGSNDARTGRGLC